MEYVVIKSQFLTQAEIEWGKTTVDYVFDLISKNNPEVVIQNLTQLQDNKTKDCLLFILQNKFRQNTTL